MNETPMNGKTFIVTQGAVLSIGKQIEHLDFDGFLEYLDKIYAATPIQGNEATVRARTSIINMRATVIGLREAQRAFRNLRVGMTMGIPVVKPNVPT